MNKAQLAELKKLAGGDRTELIKAITSLDLPEDAAVARHEDDSKKVMLPRDMSLRDGWELIKRTEEDLEKGTRAKYEFDVHYNDMLVAIDKAIKQIFGFGMLQSINMGFFGTIPPKEETVQIGLNANGTPKTVRVPAGRIALPGLFDKKDDVGYLDLGPANEQKTAGVAIAYVRKKDMGLIDKLIDVARHYIKTESIYKGAILDSQWKFLALNDFNPDTLVLSKETRDQLNAYVLTPIRKPEMSDKLGIERNRAGLLYGVYGTGKTMTMKACAVWANKEGWTSIIAKPGDSIVDLIHFGRQYQPALITVEDIDDQANGATGRTELLNEILNTMSGVLGDEDRVMILFTTNHPEKIHPAMLRPGRIHFAIELGSMDGPSIKQLTANMGDLRFEAGIKWDKLAKDFPLPPAYLKEGLNRVALFALSRGDDTLVTQEDIHNAFTNMLAHKKIEEAGKVGDPTPTLDKALGQVIANQIQQPLENLTVKLIDLVDTLTEDE